MTDDQGYGDFGVTGNRVIQTPNLDAMAGRSATMSRFYVSPVCAPTRASLMTGRYNYRTRAIDTYIGRAMMEPNEVTIAEILSGAGYATGIFGKWHLGDNYPMRPMDQGFSESLVHRGGGIGQPSDPEGAEGKYTDALLFHQGKPTPTKGYCTDVYFSAAMDWIETTQKSGKSFFAYIPTNAPHGPFHDVPKEEYELYKGMDLTPAMLGKGNPGLADRIARIYAMITNIDRNVGRLFARLDALKLTENTLVIFLVDNGPNGPRYIAGMRGAKTSVYEGGIRSPFFAHWPARLKPGEASRFVSAHIDMLPTILDACSVEPPKGLEIDGRSLLPLLERKKIKLADRAICIQAHRGDQPVRYHNFAYRTNRWKLVHASGFGRENFQGAPKIELYDMDLDPLEKKDLAAEKPELFAKLKKGYDAWFDDVGSTRPDNYAPPRIWLGTEHENPSVLTRQDWRHVKGRPWGADSRGYWLVHVARGGTFEVHARFRPRNVDGSISLAFGGQKRAGKIAKGATSHTFEGLNLKPGDTRVEVVLVHGKVDRGPWQVDVKRR
jgi:arylsulfatase/arylsulfatase A